MNDIVFITLSFTREEYEAIERMANSLDMDVKTLTRKSLCSFVDSFNAHLEKIIDLISTAVFVKRGETDER